MKIEDCRKTRTMSLKDLIAGDCFYYPGVPYEIFIKTDLVYDNGKEILIKIAALNKHAGMVDCEHEYTQVIKCNTILKIID